jgi:polysaccharide export outer membrane protein
MKRIVFFTALLAWFLSSCQTPNLTYFNDLHNGQTEIIQQRQDICFRTDDKLTIVVNSRDPQLSNLFNLPYTSQQIGASSSSSSTVSTSTHGIMCYTIDSHGEIDFPVLGKLKVAGMNREQLAYYIKSQLMERNLVNDPVVTVEYAGLAFEVLGEVKKPGRYYFDRDHFTLLDAISMAGDLDINGLRENVSVLRENGDTRTMYKVNLLSGQELFNSPVYYLQQNDIVYVEANNKRERESTVNGNTLRTPTFWMSLASFLLTIGVLVVK